MSRPWLSRRSMPSHVGRGQCQKRARQAERSKTRKPLQLMKLKEHTLVYKAHANANTGFYRPHVPLACGMALGFLRIRGHFVATTIGMFWVLYIPQHHMSCSFYPVNSLSSCFFETLLSVVLLLHQSLVHTILSSKIRQQLHIHTCWC